MSTARRQFLATVGAAALGGLAPRPAASQASRSPRPEESAVPTERPNLLLLVVDQWRGDALGVAGHPTVETPHLDLLARSGTRFTQAYAACPSCIAARAALFTGLSPRHNGFVGYRDGVPWRYATTLAGTLAAGGYHTTCVGKMHVHPPRNLLGFHNVVLHDGYTHFERRQWPEFGQIDDYTVWLRQRLGSGYADHIDTGLGCNGYAVRPWTYDDLLHPSSWVVTESIDFLRRRDTSKPFFLMASFHRPHPPLDPPRWCLDRYLRKSLPPINLGDWVDHQLPPQRGFDSPVPQSADEIDLARRAYYAQLSHIDHQLNRLVMTLYEHNVLDNTAICFVADHGEMLFDHHHVAKSLPYDASARVPLLLRLPQQAGAGTVVDRPVALRDIFPTFCDLAGLPRPAGLDGASLLPFTRGEQPAWRPWLHGEHAAGPLSNHWLTDGRQRYIWFSQSGREQLFDLVSDPTDRHDLAAARPAEVTTWRQRLVGELQDRPEGYVAGGQLVVGRPVSSTLPWAGLGEGTAG
ncbi:MAG: arylsulfatase [Fimbriimonadaceae bacterium]|nr:arylsulfatase [Fimbriimonadaceae bacterium]